MKKISCIQQYVIDSLIKDNKLSIQNLIDAMSKVCSEELFNNIISIIISNSNDNSTSTTEEVKANTDNALVRVLICSYKWICHQILSVVLSVCLYVNMNILAALKQATFTW